MPHEMLYSTPINDVVPHNTPDGNASVMQILTLTSSSWRPSYEQVTPVRGEVVTSACPPLIPAIRIRPRISLMPMGTK